MILNKHYKKIILGVLIVVMVVGNIITPKFVAIAETSGNDIADVVGGMIGATVALSLAPVLAPIMGLLYLLKYVLAVFITFTAFLADIVMNFSDNIINVEAVQMGWEVVLSFTNLGFVLAIIVMAFATILRWESYGMKQILWKLIVAALLVNFSLVICGAIISVSGVVTDIFRNGITNNGEKSMGDVLGFLSEPQKLAQAPKGWIETATGALKTAFTTTGQITFIMGLIFPIIMDFIIILTFMTLIIMLFVRAIALIFLLILSPIVWLLWIFPDTQKYWTQWWEEFIKWNIFMPVVMFFIYLAASTKGKLDSILNVDASKAGDALKNSVMGSDDIWKLMMNNIVILSLLVGGIYVANKFGIAGGDFGMKMATKASKGVGAFAGRKGMSGLRRAGTMALGNELMRDKVGKRLQEWGSGFDQNTWGGWAKRKLVGATGLNQLGNMIQLGGARQGEAAIKDSEKELGHLSDLELGRRMHTFNAAQRQFALQRMSKNDTLGLVAGGVAQYIAGTGNRDIDRNRHENEAKRYNQDKQWGDIKKSIGINEKIAQLINNANHDGTALNEKELEGAMKEFSAKLSKQDRLKLNVSGILSQWHKDKNNLFSSSNNEVNNKSNHDILRKTMAEVRLDNDPSVVRAYQAKLKGESLGDYNNIIANRMKDIDDELKSKRIFINDKNNNQIEWEQASSTDKIRAIKEYPILQKALRDILKITDVDGQKQKMSVDYLVSKYSQMVNLKKSLAGDIWDLGGAASVPTPAIS